VLQELWLHPLPLQFLCQIRPQPPPILRKQAPVSVANAAVAAHNPTALAVKVPHASPSVRKFARELGVPLAEVKGSGPKGRITQADVQSFTQAVMGGAVQTAAIAAAVSKAAPGGWRRCCAGT
jgi:pyruvate dehydrogenase E2 component (dihydrolipoamide acetyltransferase)